MMFLEMLCQVSRGIVINLKILLLYPITPAALCMCGANSEQKMLQMFYCETLQNPVIDLSSPNYRTINQKIDFLPF